MQTSADNQNKQTYLTIYRSIYEQSKNMADILVWPMILLLHLNQFDSLDWTLVLKYEILEF